MLRLFTVRTLQCTVQVSIIDYLQAKILLMLFQPDFVEEDLFIVIVRHFHFEEYCVVSRNHHVHTNLASHSLSVYTSTTLSVTYGFLLVKIFTRRTLRPATHTVQYMLKCMQVMVKQISVKVVISAISAAEDFKF